MTGSVTFTPSEADHVAAQRLWLVSDLRRPLMICFLVIMGLLEAVAIAVIATETMMNHVTFGRALAENIWPMVFPLVFIGLQVLGWWRVPRSVRRMSKQQATLLSETTWEWNSDSVVASSAAGSSVVRLPELHRWLSGKASIVLMPQERILLVLPRRVLTDDQARDIEDTLGRFARKTPRA